MSSDLNVKFVPPDEFARLRVQVENSNVDLSATAMPHLLSLGAVPPTPKIRMAIAAFEMRFIQHMRQSAPDWQGQRSRYCVVASGSAQITDLRDVRQRLLAICSAPKRNPMELALRRMQQAAMIAPAVPSQPSFLDTYASSRTDLDVERMDAPKGQCTVL